MSAKFEHGGYLNLLPLDCDRFDVISAIGTIHYAAGPTAAMRVPHEARGSHEKRRPKPR